MLRKAVIRLLMEGRSTLTVRSPTAVQFRGPWKDRQGTYQREISTSSPSTKASPDGYRLRQVRRLTLGRNIIILPPYERES